MTLIEHEAPRQEIEPTTANNLYFGTILASILGARLGYALIYLEAYVSNPASFFALNTNTLSPEAGGIAALFFLVLFVKYKHLPVLKTLDTLTPGLALMLVALGVDHILNGNAYGAPTRLPWAIFLWADYRHPTQFYETAAALIVLIVTLVKPLRGYGSGLNFWLATGLTAFSRIIVEAFRNDSVVVFGNFRAAQLWAFGALALATFQFYRLPNRTDSHLVEKNKPV